MSISFTENSYSFSKPELACVIDTHLELNVNFDRKVLEGKAILTIVKEPSITKIILDNYKLNIHCVKDFDTKKYLDYHLGNNTNFGSPFVTQLPRTIGDIDTRAKCKIQIEYETSPESPALYWLKPEQTADGTHPFLLSNNGMTYARSVFPCQDTPSVKSTYSANITVAEQFMVIMSASFVELYKDPLSHTTSYHFHQNCPIPSYAVVIVVGFLRKAKIGLRSCVFAESKFFLKSIKMFTEIDKMLQIAENLCGPYAFDAYDICVLPPSILLSKISTQCPHVTFVSPNIIGGDISLSSTIAWYIANNWAGSLVTCANFSHLWLHESLSTFIYIKILNKMYNHEEIAQYVARMESNVLQNMITKLKDTGLMKSLVPNLKDMMPNDFMQYVPYEMGCILLRELEELLGGPSVFEPFLKSYFSKFAFQSITTDDWLNFLYESFPDETRLKSIDWEKRFSSTTFAIEHHLKHILPITTLETVCTDALKDLDRWHDNSKYIPCTLIIVKASFDLLKMFFLNLLYNLDVILTPNKMKMMSILYDFQNDVHPYCIRYNWLRLYIKYRCIENAQEVLDFAIECYSPNYVCSIFQDLYKWSETHSLLYESYIKIRGRLLCTTQNELESILHLK